MTLYDLITKMSVNEQLVITGDFDYFHTTPEELINEKVYLSREVDLVHYSKLFSAIMIHI